MKKLFRNTPQFAALSFIFQLLLDYWRGKDFSNDYFLKLFGQLLFTSLVFALVTYFLSKFDRASEEEKE